MRKNAGSKKPYTIVPINPKTGKEVRRPRTYQQVKYAMKGPRGGLKPVAMKYSQGFSKGDLQGMNRQLFIKGKQNFVLYEELARRAERVEGKIKRKKDGSPVYQTKLTYARRQRKQKPVLFQAGHKIRDLDIGYQTHKKRDIANQRLMEVITPNVSPPVEMRLKGESIRDALKNLNVNIKKSDVYHRVRRRVKGKMRWVTEQKQNVFYNMVIRVKRPDGSVVILPRAGALTPDGFTRMQMMRGGWGMGAAGKVDRLVNTKREISRAIRYALKDQGLRFTKLTKLKEFAAEARSDYRKAVREDRPKEAQDALAGAPERILSPGGQFRQVPATGLDQIGKGYSVDIAVQFDVEPKEA